MAVLSVRELFCRRECVFLQSVSAFLQLIVAKIHFQLSLFLNLVCSRSALSGFTWRSQCLAITLTLSCLVLFRCLSSLWYLMYVFVKLWHSKLF